MQRLELSVPAPGSDASTVVVLGPHVALSASRTSGVPLFERCPPVHCILLGGGKLEIGDRVITTRSTEAAAQVDLSSSRLTHLMTETLGAPPRSWRAWFKLRAAFGYVMLGGATLTEAAHQAGFADSAHLTRTCKQLMGVRPAMMLPHSIYVSNATTPEAEGQ